MHYKHLNKHNYEMVQILQIPYGLLLDTVFSGCEEDDDYWGYMLRTLDGN